jgi:hypothetical protein
MPITKRQLKTIASEAWIECYKNLNNVGENGIASVRIAIEDVPHHKGNSILDILEKLENEMNERWDNEDYSCGVSKEENDIYEFYVTENSKKNACYELDGEDDDDDEVVGEDYEIEKSEE